MDGETLKRMATDPALFRDALYVPAAFGAKRFGDIMADFQRRDFAALDPSLLAIAREEVPPVRRFWLERTKGGSKDSDVAVSLLWLLTFSCRPLRIQIGAYDQQQADEIRLIIKAILRLPGPLNRVLDNVIQTQATRIVRPVTGSVAEILTTDSKGSHGSRPDVVIVNELSHVGNEEFAQTLLDNADKIPTALTIIATNAGHLDTWQYVWHNLAATSPRWHFSALTDPSPWIDEADLEESRRRNSQARFNRLWRGQWVRNEGDALDETDIEAAITLDGPPIDPQRDHRPFVGGLDIGVRRDHSAFVVLACDWINHRVALAHAQSWAPRPGIGVDLAAVRAEVESICTSWPATVLYDPSQCELLASDLRRSDVKSIPYPFTGPNCHEMANTLISAFRSRRVDLYRDERLIRDLGRLCIVEKSFGYKLEASHDPNAGHADVAFAFCIALSAAMKVATEYSPADFGDMQIGGNIEQGWMLT